MSNNPNKRDFKPLNIAVMTVSDTRTEANDTSGDTLVKLLTGAGHVLAEKRIVPDDIYRIRAAASQWIADCDINVVITTGGTGIGPKDFTPEVVREFLDKEIPGIMELIRMKYGQEKPNALLSRGVAGVMGQTLVYVLPGSVKAVNEYMEEITNTMQHLFYMLNGLDVH